MGAAKSEKVARPKYQVLEKCYLNEKFYDPETMPLIEQTGGDPDEDEDEEGGGAPAERKPMFVYFDGIPGYYLKPVNDAAKAMVEKHKGRPGVLQLGDPLGAFQVTPTNAVPVVK